MMREVAVSWRGHDLICYVYGDAPHVLFLHGGKRSAQECFASDQAWLLEQGISSVSFDHVGHGKTGGSLKGFSLADRLEQAERVVEELCVLPLTIVSFSMGGHIALRLQQGLDVKKLVLVAPAVYPAEAFTVPFGKDFSSIIRKEDAWRDSDALVALGVSTMPTDVFIGSDDEVIPQAVIDAMKKVRKDLRVTIFDGADHALFFMPETSEERSMIRSAIIEA